MSPARSWRAPALVAAILALHAGLAVDSLRRKSATFDEVSHLTAGYTYLALGDFRLNPEHPPLLKELAAAPLLAMRPRFEEADEAWGLRRQWEVGRRFLYRWNDADALLGAGRLPMVGLGLLLGLAVYGWTRRLFGGRAAGAALVLCALSPDVLAHDRLVTTDLGLALLVFVSVAAFERLAERVTWGRLLALGLAAGAAAAAKYSAGVLVPILALLAAVGAFGAAPLRVALGGLPAREVATRGARAAWLAALLAGALVVALGVVWASYGFDGRLSRDPGVRAAFDWARVAPASPAVATALDAARRARLLPEAFVYGFERFLTHSEAREAFLWGERSPDGFASFFAVSFAVKTPLALLALLGVGLVLGVAAGRREVTRWRRRGAGAGGLRRAAFVVVPVVVYAALTATRGLDIGHRHLLPVYPFVFVLGGWAAARLADHSRGRRVSAALLVGYAAATLAVHPDYLAFFNTLAGGPAGGHRVLVDSSLDWGQDLERLAERVRREKLAPLKLAYFGSAPPEYYGLPETRLPGYLPPPPSRTVRSVRPGDIVAVSATLLQGMYVAPEDQALMAELRRREPFGDVGHSIFLYRVDFGWDGSASPRRGGAAVED